VPERHYSIYDFGLCRRPAIENCLAKFFGKAAWDFGLTLKEDDRDHGDENKRFNVGECKSSDGKCLFYISERGTVIIEDDECDEIALDLDQAVELKKFLNGNIHDDVYVGVDKAIEGGDKTGYDKLISTVNREVAKSFLGVQNLEAAEKIRLNEAVVAISQKELDSLKSDYREAEEDIELYKNGKEQVHNALIYENKALGLIHDLVKNSLSDIHRMHSEKTKREHLCSSMQKIERILNEL
jgi:hypothetical protein